MDKNQSKSAAKGGQKQGRVREVEQTIYPGERQAEAIRNAKKNVHEAQMHGQAANDSLRYLENCLWLLTQTDDTPELKKLVERVQHVRGMINAMELGSFMIRVHQAMDEAYQRLP